ncbi:MAG: hypothetical protein D3919_05310 [Candidatus Electrothrix sp. AW5]|nr:hypothetical protein [Candidatus Electrothrix gigas]
MLCIFRRIAYFSITLLFLTSCGGASYKTASSTSLAPGDPLHLRYRVKDVENDENPGIEWALDPPLDLDHDAVQVLFWSGSGILKICKSGSGRLVHRSTSFLTPRPLKGTEFELSTDYVDGDGETIITLSFLRNGTYRSAAKLRVSGPRTLSGPTDQYLCSIEEI